MTWQALSARLYMMVCTGAFWYALGVAPRQGRGRPAGKSSDGLATVLEAESAAAAVPSRAASAFSRGTEEADHTRRAHGQAEATTRLVAATAEHLAWYHAKRPGFRLEGGNCLRSLASPGLQPGGGGCIRAGPRSLGRTHGGIGVAARAPMQDMNGRCRT